MLGPRIEEGGVRFCLYSKHATAVELLVEGKGVFSCERSGDVWSVFVEGVGAGTLYGYKVDGPWDPGKGHVFNRNLLLVDPYARALSGKHGGRVEDHVGYEGDGLSGRSNVDLAPRCVVVDDRFEWGGDERLGYRMEDLVIYELHVRGFTRHESSGVRGKGTFLGLVEKIPYLRDLGINAVELLPVAECFTEKRLRDLGLVNYWGYNPIAMLAPDARFAVGSEPGCVVGEFKTMVREMHRAGIEVILDVVFNHTGEQDEEGPTLSFKGIDNATYYRMEGGEYVNWTGCGNTLDFTEPVVVELAVDCLRYWAREMHVDGFRFDLGPIMGRDGEGRFDPAAPFFEAVERDEILGGVKLIAEPWDLAPVTPVVTGEFPVRWSDWNGYYRDALRRFMKGDGGMAREMAICIEGSPHVYRRPCQGVASSVNYVTCHDGFTLWDLVSYQEKHNEANGEGGRDGESENHSWNSGAEGETDDPEVNELRERRVRNLMATLMVSRGVPMILAGDEMLRTQGGNNNAYCQDNEISWLDWRLGEFRDFVKGLIVLRGKHAALRGQAEVRWHGSLQDGLDWDDPELRAMALELRGEGEDFLVIINAHWESRTFEVKGPWVVEVETGGGDVGARIEVEPRSVMVLRRDDG